MTDVLGKELSKSVLLLKAQGYAVETREVRSRKGVPAGEKRVVRQQLSGNTWVLTWALFRIDTEE